MPRASTTCPHTAPQGTVIPAVLETAINSDLPGFVRAVVSRDVRGFDGTTVLIPRGSKLIGQYRSGVALSQTRAFVVWSRVITPEGVSIDIGSPGTDQLGRGGLEGETDTHFFERFGSAILLSVMGAGLDRLADSGNNDSTAIIIGSPAAGQPGRQHRAAEADRHSGDHQGAAGHAAAGLCHPRPGFLPA